MNPTLRFANLWHYLKLQTSKLGSFFTTLTSLIPDPLQTETSHRYKPLTRLFYGAKICIWQDNQFYFILTRFSTHIPLKIFQSTQPNYINIRVNGPMANMFYRVNGPDSITRGKIITVIIILKEEQKQTNIEILFVFAYVTYC